MSIFDPLEIMDMFAKMRESGRTGQPFDFRSLMIQRMMKMRERSLRAMQNAAEGKPMFDPSAMVFNGLGDLLKMSNPNVDFNQPQYSWLNRPTGLEEPPTGAFDWKTPGLDTSSFQPEKLGQDMSEGGSDSSIFPTAPKPPQEQTSALSKPTTGGASSQRSTFRPGIPSAARPVPVGRDDDLTDFLSPGNNGSVF